MKQRTILVVAATALALTAIFLPAEWYDTIPRQLPLPFRGVTLLRLTFAMEAVVLVLIALRNVRYEPLDIAPVALVPPRVEMPFDLRRAPAMVALGAITLFGLALRAHHLNQDLWIDEITPLVDYMRLSPAQVMGSYLRSNNHLLNTLLMRVTTGALGETEWSVRLPAVVFGTLTIPGIYWVARVGLSRLASLGAALMLAASYHHVFFSQNARGYTSYLLFALLATGLLIRALRDDRLWRWVLYIAAAVLGGASLLITAFVLAGHAIVCAIAGLAGYRRGQRVAPFVRRVLAVLAIAGFIIFQIYASALPEVYAVINSVYPEPGTGYTPFSAEFFHEMARGISAGFGNPIFAGLFLLLAALGFAALIVFCWPLAASLSLAPALTAASLGIRGLTFSPRFFLLLLPLAILCAASGIQAAALLAIRRHSLSALSGGIAVTVASVLVAFAAGRSLPYYFRTPKQPYRSALALAVSRNGDGRIVVVSYAQAGFQYYARRLPAYRATRFVYTRDTATFDSLTRVESAGSPQVITTFSRALRIELPRIADRLERDWHADTTFAATVGDGEITVWSKKRVSPGTIDDI